MKKFYSPIFSILLIIFLTAQTCTLEGIVNIWITFLNSFNQSSRDCTNFTVNHDANGVVNLSWPSFTNEFVSTSYHLEFRHDGELIEQARFDNGNESSYETRIDWSSIAGGNTIEIKLKVFLNGIVNCEASETITRPRPPAPSLLCADLRLTSPLGGMANGFETFYWDALNGAVSYRLNIYDDGNSGALVTVDAGNALNTSLDVSQAAIGGETPLTVEIVAFDANGNRCSQRYEIGREAAPSQIIEREPEVAPEPEPESTPE